MEVAFVEQFTFGFGRAIGRVERDLDALESALLELHDSLANMCAAGERFVDSMNRYLVRELTEEELGSLLGVVSLMREAVNLIVSRRAGLISEAPDRAAYWPEDLHDQILDLDDGLEDLEETIGLRLSPEFQREAVAALDEARAARDKAAPRTAPNR